MKTSKVTITGILAAAIAVLLILAIETIPTNLKNQSNQSVSTGGAGTFSILLTDPPQLPENVTAVYLSFSSFQIHNTEAKDNNSGWFVAGSSGTINLMKVLNLSKIVSVSKVPEGDYNLLRFNISSVIVTYNGKNYTASTPSSTVTVVIHPKLEIESGSLSAAVLDITPTVLNVGSIMSPSFIFLPAAHATPVPKEDISKDMDQKGKEFDFGGRAWWKIFLERSNTTITITSASLSQENLLLNVKNTGNQSTILRLVIVSPLQHDGKLNPDRQKTQDRVHLIPRLANSASFLVQANGSLIPLYKFVLVDEQGNSVFPPGIAMGLIGSSGYLLKPGKNVTLTYHGPVSLFPLTAHDTIVQGADYRLTVIGTGVVSSIVLTASGSPLTLGPAFSVVLAKIHHSELTIVFQNTGNETFTSYRVVFSSGSVNGTLLQAVPPKDIGIIRDTLNFIIPSNVSSIQATLTLYTSNGKSVGQTIVVQISS
jgi:hypothetical protein